MWMLVIYQKKMATKIKLAILTVILILFAHQSYVMKQQKAEIARLENNVEAYQQMVSNEQESNRILQLTIDELNNSNDSLLTVIKDAKKELSIKDKGIVQAQVVNTVIADTITKVITVDRDFDEELELNYLTKLHITRTDSILTAKLDLRNSQVILIEEKKVFKNQYKNRWQRFWHFDYKKKIVRNYDIYNSNRLIQVTDTRVVDVTK